MKFCICIDILTRCSEWDCQMTFGIGRGFAEVQILQKRWNWPYLLNCLICFDTHYYWHGLDRGIAKSSPRDCKMTFSIGRGCAELQILKKWKWPNWVDYCNETLHTQLILTRCSPRDCQMSYGIGRGVAEVQILKNCETGPVSWNFLFIISKRYAEVQILKTSESDPLSFWNSLICICPNSEKKVKLKKILYIFICKKRGVGGGGETHLDIIFLCVT